ncbi:MAG: hypothetical protein EOP42_25955 [Sphingobacteriaceae bacterium]|nr:MAG: hypothetical protein EOP42_25955 [Sphingobacteriaceae bacterium]
MYHPFSIAETFKTAWDITKKNFLSIAVYSAFLTFVLIIVQLFNDFANLSSDSFTEFLVFLVLITIQSYTIMGFYKLIFTLIDSEYYEFNFSQIIPSIRMVLNFIIICILTGFAVVTLNIIIEQTLQNYSDTVIKVARILEVMLIIYATVRYMFCACFIVDDNSGPVESLRQSRLLTKSHFLHLLFLISIIVLVILMGFKTIGKTVLVLFPFVNVVLIVTYRKLVYSRMDVDDDVAETH